MRPLPTSMLTQREAIILVGVERLAIHVACRRLHGLSTTMCPRHDHNYRLSKVSEFVKCKIRRSSSGVVRASRPLCRGHLAREPLRGGETPPRPRAGRPRHIRLSGCGLPFESWNELFGHKCFKGGRRGVLRRARFEGRHIAGIERIRHFQNEVRHV